MTNELTKVTFRKTGKAHRGFVREVQLGDKICKRLVAACSCPGSNRGTLTKGATILCEGWDRANCGH